MTSLFSVAGKGAVITGAAGGLGAEMAAALAEEGARVALIDRDAGALAATANGVGHGALSYPADVTDAAALDAAIRSAAQAFGGLDIVIANAGVSDAQPSLAHETSDDAFSEVMDINVRGVFLTARTSLGIMKQQRRGKLITVASMWGLAAPAGLFPRPAYAASKGAVINLTRELAVEYAPFGIQVNALCPGFFRTATRPRTPEAAAAMAAYTPLGRIAEAREIRGSVLYLASAASDFVTGTALVVDGGVLAR